MNKAKTATKTTTKTATKAAPKKSAPINQSEKMESAMSESKTENKNAAPNIGSLDERAMLAHFHAGVWTGRKFDKQASSELTDSKNAKNDAARVNKLLLDSKELRELQSIIAKARMFHRDKTLPWEDDGKRILSSCGFNNYMQGMREFTAQIEEAKRAFIATYPSLINSTELKNRLGDLYSASDYPSAEEIAEKIHCGVKVWPIPSASDFRVGGISASERDAIKNEIESALQSRIQGAVNDVWNRILELTAHYADKMKEYEPGKKGQRAQGIFHDSLIQNLRELAETIPALNITNDARFDEIAKQVMDNLCQYEAEELRASPRLRADAAKEADAIVKKVTAFMA